MIKREKKFTYKRQGIPMAIIDVQTGILRNKEYFSLDDLHLLDTLVLELKEIKRVQPWYSHKADGLVSTLETLRLYKWENIGKWVKKEQKNKT